MKKTTDGQRRGKKATHLDVDARLPAQRMFGASVRVAVGGHAIPTVTPVERRAANIVARDEIVQFLAVLDVD